MPIIIHLPVMLTEEACLLGLLSTSIGAPDDEGLNKFTRWISLVMPPSCVPSGIPEVAPGGLGLRATAIGGRLPPRVKA